MKNTELWESNSKTNPEYTKRFKKKGGFSGTAINAVYLVEMATKQFGPMGINWGIDILEEHYVEGAPLFIGSEAICREVIHKLRTQLWYKIGDEVGKITHFGVTTFVGKNDKGIYTDEEAPKKSLTDALTKSLSCLGFAADVHKGMYDDNKYVAEVTDFYTNQKDPTISQKQVDELESLIEQSGADIDKFLAYMEVNSVEEIRESQLDKARKALNKKLNKPKNNGLLNESQAKIIRSKMESKNVTEQHMKDVLGIQKVDLIPAEEVANVVNWIDGL